MITNPLLAILEASRRDFLRRAGGTAVAAATKGPMGALKSVMGGALKDAGGVGGIVDKLAHLSDKELSETPEERWINIVPSERLANMVKSGTYDISTEASRKIHKILCYGIGYQQTLPILKMMAKAASKSGLNPKQMMDAAVTKHDWLYDVFGGYRSEPPIFKESGEITKEISQIYNNLDIELVGDVRNQVIKKDLTAERQAWDEHKRYEEREEERKREQKREQSRNKPEEFNPSDDYRLASSMHQSFESRLTAQLNLIFG